MELDAGAKRLAQDREMIWWGAMLPHLQKPVTLEKFIGLPEDNAARARRFHTAWDKIDRALGRVS